MPAAPVHRPLNRERRDVSLEQVRALVFAKTDLGRTRDHNEDTFLIADLTARTTCTLAGATEHEIGPRGCLFLVADGMGGAAAGEIASAMAADAVYKHLLDVWAGVDDPSPEHFAERLRDAVEGANRELHAYAQGHPEVRGMGTTATVGGIFQGALYLAQVGDSRAYLVRLGSALQLTKDQSLTQRLVDAGEMTEEEAEQSSRRNIILQALGPDPRVKVDLTFLPLCRDDVILICSDGLSGQVKRDEIAELSTRHADPEALCDALIALANSRGGPDNITVVVVRMAGEGLPVADAAVAAEYQPTPILEQDTGELPVATTPIRSTQPVPVPTAEQMAAELADLPSAPPRAAPPPEAPARRGIPLRFAAAGLGILGLLTLLYYLLVS